MKLTRGVEQAICIIIFLTTQEQNIPLSTEKISKKLEVSPSYLQKIVRKLVVAKIVTSVSGNNGGISLAKTPEEISLLDIIEAMEGPIQIYQDTGLISKTFKGGKHAESGIHILQKAFSHADNLLNEYLSNVKAADLLKESFGSSVPQINWNETELNDSIIDKSGETLK